MLPGGKQGQKGRHRLRRGPIQPRVRLAGIPVGGREINAVPKGIDRSQEDLPPGVRRQAKRPIQPGIHLQLLLRVVVDPPQVLHPAHDFIGRKERIELPCRPGINRGQGAALRKRRGLPCPQVRPESHGGHRPVGGIRLQLLPAGIHPGQGAQSNKKRQTGNDQRRREGDHPPAAGRLLQRHALNRPGHLFPKIPLFPFHRLLLQHR